MFLKKQIKSLNFSKSNMQEAISKRSKLDSNPCTLQGIFNSAERVDVIVFFPFFERLFVLFKFFLSHI